MSNLQSQSPMHADNARPLHHATRSSRTKRVMDLCIAGSAMLLLFPLFVIVAILARIVSGSPVFYRQVRPGRFGQPFTLIKFRTMSNETDKTGRFLADGDRLTRFGRFLRATSLDELPQFWNVLRGQISLVGPRPLLMSYLPRYSPEQARRHEVMPGITGWAQVNGRNALSWEEKFKFDVWYVEHWSLALDLKILWLTVRKVIRREGINKGGEATMTEFMGSQAPKAAHGVEPLQETIR
jgi:sugar transferase EpsL